MISKQEAANISHRRQGSAKHAWTRSPFRNFFLFVAALCPCLSYLACRIRPRVCAELVPKYCRRQDLQHFPPHSGFVIVFRAQTLSMQIAQSLRQRLARIQRTSDTRRRERTREKSCCKMYKGVRLNSIHPQ